MTFPIAVDIMSRAAHGLGVDRAFLAFRRHRLLALNYHGVVPDEYTRDPVLYGNVISVSEFSRQMAIFTRLFHPIGISELRDWQAGKGCVGRKPVLITFDDGYRNNLIWAAPVLQHFGIPAVISICTGYIGQKRILWPDEIHRRVLSWPQRVMPVPFPWREQRIPDEFSEQLALAGRVREACKRLPEEQLAQYFAQLRKHPLPDVKEEVYAFLSWEEVRTLKSRGFEIGGHTMEHPILTRLPRATLVRELRESKRIIEQQIGCECACFAYPNGGAADISPEVVEEVRRAGYSFAFTVMGGLASPGDDPLLLDRVYMPDAVSMAGFHCRISGFHGTVKRWMGW